MSKRKTSLPAMLLEITAGLRWHWGVVLALVSYAGFHYLASSTPMMPLGIAAGQTPGAVITQGIARQLIPTVASFLQYIIPLVFLLGAAMSAANAYRRARLHGEVARSPIKDTLETMSWREFEALVGEAFRRKGYTLIERGGAGADGGVDVELRMGKDKYLVQCKHWKTRRVGVATVRELFGVMHAEGAAGGFIVASGDFTAEARHLAEGRSIDVVDANTLIRMIAPGSAQTAQAPAAETPACPQCGIPMVKRQSTRGRNQNLPFWGCSSYPACRGIRREVTGHAG